LAANLVAVSAAYGTGLLLQRRFLPRVVSDARPEFETATWIRASTHFVTLTGANQVMLNMPLIAVGVVRGPTEAALFALAWRLASLVIFGYAAVNKVLAPAIAKLWAEDETEPLQRMVTFTARLALLSTLPPAIVFLVAGQWVLGLFGPVYALAATTLAILTIGQMVNAATGNVFLLLTMTGYQTLGAAAQTAVAVAGVPLALILVSLYGINGAAASYVMTLVTVNLIWMWLVGRKIGVATTALGVFRRRPT
jgi:O-antigen/teichoic acid export membrane protein